VRVAGYAIQDLVDLPAEKLKTVFLNMKLSTYEEKIASRLLIEIRNRLEYLCDVGLGYLTLNRLSSTLSGGDRKELIFHDFGQQFGRFTLCS